MPPLPGSQGRRPPLVLGVNSHGQLGQGNSTAQSSPVQVYSGATNWTAVTAGNTHSLGLQVDNSLWTWGLNVSGQLGLGDTADQLSPMQVPRFNAPRTAVILLF